jgi:hypothetical protein
MRHDVVSEKIEIGPAFQLSAFGTLQHLAIGRDANDLISI